MPDYCRHPIDYINCLSTKPASPGQKIIMHGCNQSLAEVQAWTWRQQLDNGNSGRLELRDTSLCIAMDARGQVSELVMAACSADTVMQFDICTASVCNVATEGREGYNATGFFRWAQVYSTIVRINDQRLTSRKCLAFDVDASGSHNPPLQRLLLVDCGPNADWGPRYGQKRRFLHTTDEMSAPELPKDSFVGNNAVDYNENLCATVCEPQSDISLSSRQDSR
jgi:hypothetical protein